MPDRAAPTGRPATEAPAANTSGYAASKAAAIAPPADSPTTKTRLASLRNRLIAARVMAAMDPASPASRAVSDG